MNIFSKPLTAVLNENNYSIENHLTVQNGAKITGEKHLYYANEWNGNYLYNIGKIKEHSYKKEKIIKSGEIYYLNDKDSFDTLKVERDGSLIIGSGEIFIKGLLQIDANSNITFLNPGQRTIIHLDGKLIWHHYTAPDMDNTTYWFNVAKGFKLIQYSSETMYIEGKWGGTIIAPIARIVLGQSSKKIFGSFLGKDVIVHQYSKLFHVKFNPVNQVQFVCK